ncbi:hypothetical protein CONCODRAFT_77193 [Conidiobolus coronatus NRRL 28638]|uniref:Pkr1-domain-containing protein n=1 Tax=Conidiobolus coronatus (strain ATCC 28846 / CBS 209.66 / NRRL 28638) TaxID=796925 RepID=A0A137PFN3_CONC2|nr:hypothetical protein CONCODRAFT_77193 [Conidiobolus coronatus NRRL 28638]|eukprot:KXN73816.1 hypothetical protein CONCODRAFT_77193 [Conidiobolus coronatus NRRL 28638]
MAKNKKSKAQKKVIQDIASSNIELPESDGLIQTIINSIFTPGANPVLVRMFDCVMVFLITTLAIVLFIVGFNIHLAFFLVFSIGFLAAFHWFLYELEIAKQNEDLNETESTDKKKK